MTSRALATVMDAPAEGRSELLDVAIALLGTARGRNAAETALLIDASTLLLNAVKGQDQGVGEASGRAVAPALPRVRKVRPAAGPRKENEAENGGGHAAIDAAGAAPAGAKSNGVTVDFTPAAESVGYAGKSMEVSARQAQLFALLARTMPHPIGRDFLVNKLWPGKRPNYCDQMLSTMVRDAAGPAAALGLELVTVRGVGIVLRKAGEVAS